MRWLNQDPAASHTKSPIVFALALVFLFSAAACAKRITPAVPAPSQSSESIGNTGVPWPPDEYQFDRTNRSDLIVSSRFEYHLFFSPLSGSPADLATTARQLYDFYATAMPENGWTLYHATEIQGSDDPSDPEGTVSGGFEWHRNLEAIAISISNYQALGNEGSRLNLLVTYLGKLTSEPPPPTAS